MVAEKYSYRNLIVWQRAQELALAVMQLVQQVPQSWANAVIVRQIVGSATSIGANIAEGHGRYTVGAHRNHLSIARGSAAETDSWLDLMRRSGWIGEKQEAQLHQECNELIAILTSKMRKLDAQGLTGNNVRETRELYGQDQYAQQSLFPFDAEDYTQEI